MKILYSPQRSDDKIEYQFNGEIIIAVINGESDAFDFSNLPNGKLENVETNLPVNPIVKAERKDGELFVELVYYHGKNATQEELFPKWQVIE